MADSNNGMSFPGVIGRYGAESTPWWPAPSPSSQPNVAFIVLDDVGFGHLGCYGSSIETPNIDRLAAGGLRYNNFHTTTLCSPSRACLLTGRNHHSVGMKSISNYDRGFPNGRGAITTAAATLPHLLRAEGYSTYAVGKWHLAPMSESSAAGPFDNWPLGKGFERYYGFLDALTDQFAPVLISDNHHISPHRDEGYHLSEDLVDRAIAMLRDQHCLMPERPFFLYLAFGACHSPHQAPPAFLAKYRGRFDHGWDEERARVYVRQKAMGIIPPETELAPRNPGVHAWDELPEDQRRVAARLQEAYAAMLDHTDAQIGRFVDFLRELGQLDNTLIVLVSDNGASQEGGPLGIVNEGRFYNQLPADPDYNLAHIEEIGGPSSHTNFPWGWAQVGNTPLKRYKQNTHGGGIRDPLIVHWPEGVSGRGDIRTQFHHITDIAPAVLEVLGLELPAIVQGVPQKPIQGVSMAYTFDQPTASTRKLTQYFEMFGHRAIYHDGWKAVTYHEPGSSFDDDRWELYHVAEDFSECHDLAEEQPAKLREMIERWWTEAGRYGVLPLEDARGAAGRPRPGSPQDRAHFTYLPGMAHVPTYTAPDTRNRSFTITAVVERASAGDEGVLIAHGGQTGGYSFYIQDNHLCFDYNWAGVVHHVNSEQPLPVGRQTLRLDFRKTGRLAGEAALFLDNERLASGPIPHTLGGMFALEGLDIGQDSLTPVSDRYQAPFPFAGQIERIDITLGDDQQRDTVTDLQSALSVD